MLESGILESASSLGVGAFLGCLIFFMYRRDRKDTEKRIEDISKHHCDRMDAIIERDQHSREANTAAITELTTYLKKKNGSAKQHSTRDHRIGVTPT